jgi:CRISPR-associated protein Csx10
VTIRAKAPTKPPAPSVIQAGDRLYVWLLSDLLLRGPSLRAATSLGAVREALEQGLGVGLSEVTATEGSVAVAGRARRTESWHTGWQLPRPTLAGLAAGTCLAFTADAAVAPEKLVEVLQGGLGERRAEGYGQIAINDRLLTDDPRDLRLCKVEPSSSSPETAECGGRLRSAGETESGMAYQVQRAAWREAIRRAAVELAASQGNRTKLLGIQYPAKADGRTRGAPARPGQSQLMAFLAALRRVKEPGDSAAVAWLDYAGKTKGRQEDWAGSLGAVRQLLMEGPRVWQALSGEDVGLVERLEPERLVVADSEIGRMKSELWPEAVWTLADACIRAHRRRPKDAAREGGGS